MAKDHGLAFVHIAGRKVTTECLCGHETDGSPSETEARTDLERHLARVQPKRRVYDLGTRRAPAASKSRGH